MRWKGYQKMKSKDMVRRILTIMTAAIMAVTSFGFVSDFGTKAFAEPSSGKMIAGAEALKEGVNTDNAHLVHYGDRYWYVIGYDREGVAAGSGEVTLLSKDSIKSTAFDKNYSAVYSSSNLKNEIEAYTNEKLSAGEKSAIASRDKVSGTLMMNAVSSGSKALKLSWTKVNNAAGYDIYMAKCSYKGRSYTFKKVKTISGNKTFKWTYDKLSKHTAYKGYVRAYTIKNGKKVYVRRSPMVHAFTGNYRNSLTNPKSIKVNKTSVSIANGKTATIEATVTKVRSGLVFGNHF